MTVKNLVQQIVHALIHAKSQNDRVQKGKMRRATTNKWKQAYYEHYLALYLWAMGHFRASITNSELESLLDQFAQEQIQRNLHLDQAQKSSIWWIQEFKRWHKGR